VKRRDFIALLGGAAAASSVSWPIAARAQQATMPVIGFLRSAPQSYEDKLLAALGQGLKETGLVERQNVTVDFRSADGRIDRLPALAAELIQRPVAVVVADNVAAIAVKAATTTVPIVFATGGDPVQAGLVASLNRPGGNVTGVSFFSGELGSKRLELLRQLAPKATLVAMLMYPDTPTSEAERKDVEAAAQAIGQQLVVLRATSDGEIESAFATIVQRRAGAVLLSGSAFLSSRTQLIAALASRHAIPAMYFNREAVVAGGLIGYGASLTEAYRQAGVYAGRILKGEQPADLPVMRSTKFELVLNLKTAKALGLDVPDKLLALADEVIE
jgi:putative tryptophan/tyrosine transport system substrate-binding protein